MRLAAITLAGAVLYYAGLVNSMVIDDPSAYGAALVVCAIGLCITLLLVSLRGDGRGDATAPPDRRYVRIHRIAWLVACVMAVVGASWFAAGPRGQASGRTPSHNDPIAPNEWPARLSLARQDPYPD